MKIKKQIKDLLTDPKHWIGWILSAGAVFGVVYWLRYLPTLSITKISAIVLTIIIVDIFKHLTKLQ